MRIALGAYRTSPSICILSECNMLPLNIRRKQIIINYATKLIHSPNNQAFDLFQQNNVNNYRFKKNALIPFYQRALNYLKDYNIDPHNIYTIKQNRMCPGSTEENTNIQKFVSSIEGNRSKIVKLYPTYQHIFTAITTQPDHIEAAATFYNNENIVLKFPKCLGVQASIQLLIIYIIENNDNKIRTVIHTDSNILNNSLLNKSSKNTNIQRIQDNLCRQEGTILIYYSTQPCDNPNESNSTKLLYNLHNVRRAPKFSIENTKRITQAAAFNECNNQWKESLSSTQLMKIKPDALMKNPALSFNRREQIVISRLRIGHTPITHQHIFRKEEPPICDTCNTTNNIEHILIHCEKYKENRKKTKISQNLKKLLNNKEGCAKAIEFLKKCKLIEYII